MKFGGDLPTVLSEVRRMEAAKVDLVVPKGILEMVIEETQRAGSPIVVPKLTVNRVGARRQFGIRDRAHEQLAQELGIPTQYYRRMLTDDPELLTRNVNAWLWKDRENARMLRTIDGDVRAYLSDRYRPLDNYDLAAAVLPVLNANGVRIESIAITEDRFYICAVSDRISGEVRVGDAVQAGLVVSNSEVGAGSLRVEPMIYRLVCMNGAIRPDGRMRKYHVGRRRVADGDPGEESPFLSEETRKLDDRAFFAKVRDTVAGSFNADLFAGEVRKLRAAAGEQVTDPAATLDLVSERHGFTDSEKDAVLDAFIKGGDPTRYGLMNAVTLTAQGVESYDRSKELERVGGSLLDEVLANTPQK